MDKKITAVVAYSPTSDKHVWKTESVRLIKDIEKDEVLVRMVAAGICHSDFVASSLMASALGIELPKVLGHEGAGIVERVGQDVADVKEGDRVLLSYCHCQTCHACTSNNTSRCEGFSPLNVLDGTKMYETDDGTKIAGNFFGQSSFAELSVVKKTSIIVVNDLVKEDELKLLAPLGCGLMTGSGAVITEARAGLNDVVLVTGLGAVGLGALMAAKVSGCKAIIAVDRVASRLELAKTLGANFVLNTSESTDWTTSLRGMLINTNVTIAIETTGIASITRDCISTLGAWGKLVQVGVPALDSKLELSSADYFYRHITVMSTNMGGGQKADNIRRMIQWWRDGVFPVDKLVKFFDARSQVDAAVQGMKDGSVIKPVLVW